MKTVNFLFCEFLRWRMLQSRLNICIDMFFRKVILSHALQDRFLKKSNNKAWYSQFPQ